MILGPEEIQRLRGTVAMVDGSFDPLHDGHIRYFSFAASLGLPVLCNIAGDDWTTTKHKVLLERERRAFVIDAIRFIDFVYCTPTTTADVLRKLRPRKYVKGSDWLARGGIPLSEALICEELGIEVVYADTEMNSSSALLSRFLDRDE